jgi:hypothetical protein
LDAGHFFLPKIRQEGILRMSIRGVYGFRCQEQDKLTFNYDNSGPSCLGGQILAFIRETPAESMRGIFDQVTLVDDDDPEDSPSEELQEKYREFSDRIVSPSSLYPADWYHLLRKAQGDLGVYAQGVRHMPDYSSLIKDSLLCEYGYIVNLDAEALEFWLGNQKEPDSDCRYGVVCDEDGYYPCRMMGALAFSDIRRESLGWGIRALIAMEKGSDVIGF